MEENSKVIEKQAEDETKENIPNLVSKNTSIQQADKLTINHLNNINLFDNKQLAAAEVFLNKIVKSEKGGIKNVNDGLAILMRAQDLELPFSACLEHIHVINGKTGIDIHLIKALLLRAGVTWDCTKNYTPLYEFTDGFNVYIDGNLPDYVVKVKNKIEADNLYKQNKETLDDKVYVYPVKYYKDYSGNIYKDYQLNTTKFVIVSNKTEYSNATNSGKIPVYRIPNMPVDYITEYKFTRIKNGKEITAISSFSYSEAKLADMLEKDTYKKYPKVLIGHRAFTYGARDIASDVLFGAMETTELKIINDQILSPDDFDVAEEVG